MFCGVSRRIHTFHGPIHAEQSAAGKLICQQHAIEDRRGFHCASCFAGDGRVEAAAHRLRTLRRLHARRMIAQTGGEKGAAATVQVDTDASQAGQLQHIVPRPQPGGKGVAHAGLAAAIAGVPLGHPIRPSARTRRSLNPPGLGRNVWIAAEQPLNRHPRIIRRALRIVMAGQCHHPRIKLCRKRCRKACHPGGGSADVGSAEANSGHFCADGLGKAHPFLHVFGKAPIGRARAVVRVVIEIGLVADLKKLQAAAHRLRHISRFCRSPPRRAVAEVETVDQPPTRCLQKTGQGIDRFRGDGKQPVRHPVGCEIARRQMQLRFRRRRVCLEPAKLAGIAADAQDSLQAQKTEILNQIAIGSGEKLRIGQLRQLIAQARIGQRDLRRPRLFA